MKILVLYEHPHNGGSMSIQGHLLYRGLKELGVDCRPCHYEHREKEREWQYASYRPDVVLGIGWWVDTPTIIQAPQLHGLQPVPWLLADGWVANYHDILNDLPLVFTTSQWVTDVYTRDGVNTKNFEVLPVGLDAERFRPLPADNPGVRHAREMFGIKENEKFILTIGGDTTSKGAQEMIKALAIIDKEYPQWKYLCKSTGSEDARNHHKEELKLIREVGLDPDKIIYAEDDFSHEFMPYLLNACDIYAAPSRIEGFGMIQVEAMACGTPVISIDAMGPKDTIIHGETGFLAKVGEKIDLTEEWVSDEMGIKGTNKIHFDKPKTFAYRADIHDLAEYTGRLLTDDALMERIGEKAAEHARVNFAYPRVAEKCLAILHKKLNNQK